MSQEDFPERVYLQVGPDFDHDHDKPDFRADVTWCRDQIFDTDVEYVRADLYEDLKAQQEWRVSLNEL